MQKKIKILYIAGFERSGSTLVNRVLGQIDSFVAWGEIRDIWEHAILQNRSCSCGKLFHDCSVWNQVLKEGFGGISKIDAERLLEYIGKAKKYIAAKHILPIELKPSMEIRFYLDNLSKLYRAIQACTDCRVIVDSTKASWYGSVLRELPNFEVYVLHITRDPRGVCHSLQRRKLEGEPECAWYNPVHASVSWTLKNASVESFLSSPDSRYLRIRLEDFVSQPRAHLNRVLDMLDEPDLDLSFIEKDVVTMRPDHIFTGSPSSRSKVGEIKLRVDDRWRKEMSYFDKAAISLLTAAVKGRYS